jgi:hypothetical protein
VVDVVDAAGAGARAARPPVIMAVIRRPPSSR